MINSLGPNLLIRRSLAKIRFQNLLKCNYSSVKGAIFGDERDLIAKKLIAEGGVPELVIETLKTERQRFTHDPVPYSSSIPTIAEQPHLSNPLDPTVRLSGRKKVSIIGCGQVGLATCYSLLNKGICGEISLVDMDTEKLEGEVKDLQHGSAFVKKCGIEGSTEYDITEDSDFVIVTAGVGQTPGESRLNLVGRNVPIMKDIISKVLAYSPNAPICIVSNPCDVMTVVAAKIAGADIPPGRYEKSPIV